VQEAVLATLDKAALLAAVFPEQEVVLVAAVGGKEIDARTVDYNPELAVRLLTAADRPGGFGAQFFYPAEDRVLADLAQRMAAYLAKVGIEVKLIAASAADLRAMSRAGLVGRAPTLWLGRR
jgi:ABC-type transport system substrate-binding protein